MVYLLLTLDDSVSFNVFNQSIARDLWEITARDLWDELQRIYKEKST